MFNPLPPNLPAWAKCPAFRWAMRILTVACAIDSFAYLIGGAVLMVAGFTLWQTPLRADLATALGRSARNGHDFGVAMLLGLGAMVFLYGAYEVASLVREAKE